MLLPINIAHLTSGAWVNSLGFEQIGTNLHVLTSRSHLCWCVCLDMNLYKYYTAFSCFFYHLKDADFHDCQYNYFYEWVLQSLLWLDNDIITTTVCPCLTSHQHRSSVLFLFMLRVCRRINYFCWCKCSNSVFFEDTYASAHVCLCTAAVLLVVQCSQKFDAYFSSCLHSCRRCPWACVWCLMCICGHEFSLLFRDSYLLEHPPHPFLPLSPVFRNKPLILGLLFFFPFQLVSSCLVFLVLLCFQWRANTKDPV